MLIPIVSTSISETHILGYPESSFVLISVAVIPSLSDLMFTLR
ncbi:uncharacterized protein METZ01_LOCUS417834 [marine metagenome]|uniref:Uncharacterized protein n=1 Tax=marine metagenome TaxID=408172 RepID=A0A382X292_9ZZZZ